MLERLHTEGRPALDNAYKESGFSRGKQSSWEGEMKKEGMAMAKNGYRIKRFESGAWFGAFFGPLLIGLFIADSVLPQTPFYAGKTITVILSSGPGGTADLRTRAVVSVLRKHIPGNPTLVMAYMTGGGGRKAANHIYATARPDGLTIGAMGSAVIPAAILGETGVAYDIDKWIYLGTFEGGTPYVFFTRKDAGLNSVEKVRAASGVRIGSRAVGHIVYYTGRIFAYMIGVREPKFVAAFGGEEAPGALMRGELDAYVTIPDGIVLRNPEWIDTGLMDFHTIVEVPKGRKHSHPFFARLPDLENFAKSERDRKLLATYRAFQRTGMTLVLPPGTPRDRVQMLQEAARKTFKDPEYYKEFRKLVGSEPTPLMPEELEKVIKDLPREPDVLELFKELAGPGPIPPRR